MNAPDGNCPCCGKAMKMVDVDKNLFDKFKEVFSIFKSEKHEQNGAFTAVKQADGRYRWVAVYSDTNWDRDKERFTEEAHKDYVEWADKTKSYPDLRLWHIPGTSFGKTDMIDMDSHGYMVATGLVDIGKEYVVENLRKSSKVLGISHGFYFSSLINGEYPKGYRTYEISVLPWEKAANENTGFFAGEETPMLTPEKKAFIATTLGNDFATKLEATLAEASSKAKEKGVSFKELMEVVMDAEVAAKETAKESKSETTSPIAIESIMEQMKAYFEPKFAEVSSTLKSYEEKFIKLETSDDDKISKAMSQKKGFNPTEDASTQVNGNDKEVKVAKSEMLKTSEFQLPERFKDYAGLLKIPAGVE